MFINIWGWLSGESLPNLRVLVAMIPLSPTRHAWGETAFLCSFSGVRKMCRDLETSPGLNEKAMAKAALAISRVWGFCRHESSERGPDIYLISLMKLNDFCWRVAHFHFCIELYIVYSPDHKHLIFTFIYLLCVWGCWWCVYTTAYVCRSEVSSHFLPCGFWGLNSGHQAS